MSATEKILSDLGKATVDARDFVGEFVYAPFGIETSNLINGLTLVAALAVVGMIIYQILRPAPHARVKRNGNEYDFGRNV